MIAIYLVALQTGLAGGTLVPLPKLEMASYLEDGQTRRSAAIVAEDASCFWVQLGGGGQRRCAPLRLVPV